MLLQSRKELRKFADKIHLKMNSQSRNYILFVANYHETNYMLADRSCLLLNPPKHQDSEISFAGSSCRKPKVGPLHLQLVAPDIPSIS
jgi:hypothetical protein